MPHCILFAHSIYANVYGHLYCRFKGETTATLLYTSVTLTRHQGELDQKLKGLRRRKLKEVSAEMEFYRFLTIKTATCQEQ